MEEERCDQALDGGQASNGIDGMVSAPVADRVG